MSPEQEHKGYVPLSMAEHNKLTHLISDILFTEHPPVIIPAEAILGIGPWLPE